jgi:hypothetical protein
VNIITEQMLYEDKGGKNLHLEHIEDEILNYGVDGGRASINFIQSLRDMFAGATRSSINMTVKWDGAPAIFAGVDPEDNKFFVGKKSVFNVEPQLYKTNADIDKYTSGDLNAKFKVALEEFPKLGIRGVIQGDLMFTNDVGTQKIDGIDYYTFQPNTIVYAAAKDSDLGKQINSAKIGVVWHTTYKGEDLQGMKASFGVDISRLKNVKSIWMDDATYKDVSGSATFTQSETDKITKELSNAGSTFRKINSMLLKKFLNLQGSLTGTLSGLTYKTYNNTMVRAGKPITNPKRHAIGYMTYFKNKMQEQIDKMKSPAGKKKYETIQKEYDREFKKHVNNLQQIAFFQNYIIAAKMLVINKLNSVKSIGTFIRTSNGFKAVNPEGYVAIDRVSGGAVKLVDRMEFSFNNFTAAKAWDK